MWMKRSYIAYQISYMPYKVSYILYNISNINYLIYLFCLINSKTAFHTDTAYQISILNFSNVYSI